MYYLSSANAFSLDQFEILSFSKEKKRKPFIVNCGFL